MGDINNLKEYFENVKGNMDQSIEHDLDMARLKEELKKSFNEYNQTMRYMASDAPIEILCLPTSIEKILTDQGLLRVYDLLNVDLVKIKGLSVVRIKQLTARLDQFFAML